MRAIHTTDAPPAALIRAMFAHIDARDWEALASTFHPDIVYQRPGHSEFTGLRRVLDFYQRGRAITSSHHQIDGIIAESDVAVCWGGMKGTLNDGSKADIQFAEVYSLVSGRITTRRSYFFQAAL